MEIIAIRFHNLILFGEKAWDRLRNNNYIYDQLFSREEFKFMSMLDLGKKWRDAAEDAPTLFILPEEFRNYSYRNPNPYRG